MTRRARALVASAGLALVARRVQRRRRRPARSSTSPSTRGSATRPTPASSATCSERQLGFTVEYKDLAEQVSWEGFETGEVDAIVENWGHADLIQTYVTDKAVAVAAGSTGIDGIIGWFVPPWMAEQYPDITDWNKLNGYAEMFKTSESGDKGQFLAGDPSFVTSDQGIIDGLELDFQVVYAGSEAALIEAFRKAEQDKTPLLGYFYSPQWFLNEVPLVKIEPAAVDRGLRRGPGERSPATTRRTRRSTSTSARTSRTKAPKAAQFIKNFTVDGRGPEHRRRTTSPTRT